MTSTSAPETLVRRAIDSPVGTLTLVAHDTALVAVLWPDDQPGRVRFAHEPGDRAAVHHVLDAAEIQLGEYFSGDRRRFDVALEPSGTEFQRAVWRALAEIPYGETSTYGKQAAAVGRPRAVRAVGTANGRNPLSIVLPCHRIVAANGGLAGFAGGLDTKRWLLDHERRVAAG